MVIEITIKEYILKIHVEEYTPVALEMIKESFNTFVKTINKYEAE